MQADHRLEADAEAAGGERITMADCIKRGNTTKEVEQAFEKAAKSIENLVVSFANLDKVIQNSALHMCIEQPDNRIGGKDYQKNYHILFSSHDDGRNCAYISRSKNILHRRRRPDARPGYLGRSERN